MNSKGDAICYEAFVGRYPWNVCAWVHKRQPSQKIFKMSLTGGKFFIKFASLH